MYFVYIMASDRNGTFYVGVTNDLLRRVEEHKRKIGSDFTRTYNVDRLVYYESHEEIRSAITREKQLKKWKRIWKMRLIEEQNPCWDDLYDDMVETTERRVD